MFSLFHLFNQPKNQNILWGWCFVLSVCFDSFVGLFIFKINNLWSFSRNNAWSSVLSAHNEAKLVKLQLYNYNYVTACCSLHYGKLWTSSIIHKTNPLKTDFNVWDLIVWVEFSQNNVYWKEFSGLWCLTTHRYFYTNTCSPWTKRYCFHPVHKHT